MSSVENLGEIVGKTLTDDLAGRLAGRALKVGALGAERLLPSQDGSLGVIDLDNPLLSGDGYQTKLLAAGTYTKQPELFYGPFMQLGTYLKGKGIIQSDALALGIDILGPDPINLATLGTGGLIEKATGGLISGLTRSGKVAKLASAIRDTKGAMTGAEFVTHVADALEGAAKVAGASPEWAAAAKAGNSKAAIDILKTALDTGKLSAEDTALLTKLRESGKAIGDVLKHADEIGTKGVLSDSAYLGETIGQRISRGQVNPFLKIAKPDIAKPWNIPLQMMGFEVKGQTYWMPGSTNIAGGLEKAAKSPGLSAYNATVGLSINRVLTGVPQDQLFRDFEAAGIKTEDLAARFRERRRLSPNTEVEGTPEFEAWKERVLDRFTGLQRAYDQAAVRRANETIEASVAALEGLRPGLEQAIAGQAINKDYAAQMGSMLRRLHEDMGVRALRRDMGEPGFGIPARQSFATLIARQTVVNVRDIIEQGYQGPLMREAVAELFGPAVAHPQLWEEVGGRLVLRGTPEEVAKESPFLASVLQRAPGREATAALEARLRTEGLDAGLSHVIKQTQITLDATGKNLLHEGVVQGLLHDYFPRVFRPNEKFFAEFGGSTADSAAAMERLFASDDGDILLANLGSKTVKEQLDKAGQGKLSMAEARAWTESVAQRMEAAGYGVYKKDGPELLGHYMEAASSALLLNRVLHDLPNLGGALTFADVAERIGSKEAAKIPQEAFRKASRVMAVNSEDDIPKELRGHFTRIDPRYRTVPASRDTEKLLGGAEASEIAATERGRGIEREVMRSEMTAEATAAARSKAAAEEMVAIKRGSKAIDEASRELAAAERQGAVATRKAMQGGLRSIRDAERAIGGIGRDTTKALKGVLDDLNPQLERIDGLLKDAQRSHVLKEGAERAAERGTAAGERAGENVAPLRDYVRKAMGSARRIETKADVMRKRAEAMMASAEKKIEVHEARIARSGKPLAKAEAEAIAATKKAKDSLALVSKKWGDIADAARKAQGKSADILGRAEVRGSMAAQKGALVDAAKKARTQVSKELWVFTPDYAHLQQALHLYAKGEGVPGWLRKYRDWNYRFKSVLLSLDIYHLNTLSISQLMTDPTSALKVLATAKGMKRAAIGAGVGAGVGIASDRDARGVAGLSLAGAIYGAAITAALERAGNASRVALNPGNVDTLYRMGRGGWIGKPDDRAIGVAAAALKAISDRLASDVAQGAVKPMLHPIDKVRHMAEAWEQTLWEVSHNGSKHFYFDVMWRRELPKLEKKPGYQIEALKAEYDLAKQEGRLLPGDTSASKFIERRRQGMEDALARELVQSANNTFGGQNWANLLNHPEYQRQARDFLLSPDWTASRTAMTATYLMNMGPMKRAALGAGIGAAIDFVQSGGDPEDFHPARAASLGAAAFLALGKWADGIQKRMMVPGDVMRKEAARMSASALLGGYTFANALNLAFTGHFLWENDEGRKTQIGLGDGSYVALGKPWVEAFEFAGVYHPERYPAPVASRLFSKAAPIPHAVLRVLTNTNDWGGPLITADDGPLDIAYKDMSFAIDAVAPIGLQGISRVGAAVGTGQYDPRQLQSGLLRTTGFQTSVPSIHRGGGLLGGPMGEPGNLSDLLSVPSLGDPTNLMAGRL